jgi:hypothetical protein
MIGRISIITMVLCFFHLLGNAQYTQEESDVIVTEVQDSIEYYSDEIDSRDDYEEAEGDYSNDEYEELSPIDYYDQRTVDSTKWANYKKDKRFNYRIKPKKKKKDKKPWSPDLSFLNGAIFKMFLYFVVAALIGYVLFLFFKNNEFSFKRSRKKTVVTETPWEEVEHFEDWELALKKAEDAQDYRLAVRILYLQTLQKLNNQSLISYAEEKTNWHYVQKVFGTTYYEPFKVLTTYFDYIWYGNYNVEQERYQEVKNSFINFHNTMYT